MASPSNRIPGCLLLICVLLSGTILPTGLLLLGGLFYGREFLQHEALMGLTAVQWLVGGTLALMIWVAVLRALFVVASRWITRNNRAHADNLKSGRNARQAVEGE